MVARAQVGILSALLLISLFVASVPPADGATVRVLAITNGSAKPTVPFKGFDGNPPKVFDIDGDGDLEIIAQNDNQWVYIFDSRNGALLAELKTVFPSGWGARSFNGPEVAILSDGGSPRLVLMNSAAVLTVYRFDALGSSSTRFLFHKEWERRLSDCYSNPGSDSKPTLADLDRDGRLEIIATTEESGIYVFRSNGDLYWKKCIGGGNAEASVGDLNRDGWLDVVHVSDGGVVSALNGRTGAYMWAFDARTRFNLGSGSMPVGATVAQLDGLTGPDVVVGARDSHDAENFGNNHALLLALSAGGNLLWGRQDPQGNPLTYTHPIVVDADRDGSAEVYWADWNTMGHKPPWNEADAWKVTGPANFYRYDKSGHMVWRQSLGTWWQNKDLALADVDGDGVQEVLANGPNANGHDGIWYLDSRTGAKEAFVDLWPWQLARGPIVADLYGNGGMQWVAQVGPSDPSAGGPGILVYDTRVKYNSAWPHLPYTSMRRGNEPPPTSTTPPPTSSGGRFAATFTIKSPNEWWQEVDVKADDGRAIVSVDIRVNGGAWQPMTKSSWGSWTKSLHTPAGTRVEFLAKDASGGVSQSQPFTWMDGVLTKRSTDSTTTTTPPPTTTTQPPGGSFGATFTIKSPNEWWQEVDVKADDGRAIASVQIRVNGGAWQSMTKSSWGSWTKSVHTPAGTRVEFLARDAAGSTSQSQPFTWMDGVLTKRSTTGGEGGSFTASFTPRAVGNDWWVEVEVQSGHTIVAVHTSVNGGAWTALDRTSWGTWAKSIHAPNGSSVRFQATNSAGATAVSSTYTWT